MLCDAFKDQKAKMKGIRFEAHARTTLVFVTLRADEEWEFMLYGNPSTNKLFEIIELDTNLLKQVTYCLLM